MWSTGELQGRQVLAVGGGRRTIGLHVHGHLPPPLQAYTCWSPPTGLQALPGVRRPSPGALRNPRIGSGCSRVEQRMHDSSSRRAPALSPPLSLLPTTPAPAAPAHPAPQPQASRWSRHSSKENPPRLARVRPSLPTRTAPASMQASSAQCTAGRPLAACRPARRAPAARAAVKVGRGRGPRDRG
jgi:hypothetical protein